MSAFDVDVDMVRCMGQPMVADRMAAMKERVALLDGLLCEARKWVKQVGDEFGGDPNGLIARIDAALARTQP